MRRDQVLGKGQRVALALDTEKSVHAALRLCDAHARQRAQALDQDVAARSQPIDQTGHEVGRDVQRGQCPALHEDRGAGTVEFDQLADCVLIPRRQHQPAQSPTRHQKGLGKALCDDQPVFGLGDVEKARRGHARTKPDPLVDLVGKDPGAGLAAMFENGLLFGARQGPASGVVWRIDQQHLRQRRDRIEQSLQIQRPGAVGIGRQRHPRHLGAQDGRLRGQVRPHRHHRHHLVASTGQHLHGQHQCRHAGRRDRDAVGTDRPVKGAGVGGQPVAQRVQAQVVRVEGLAAHQGCGCGLAHHGGRDLVALAKPECQHVVAPQAGIGDLANARSWKLLD